MRITIDLPPDVENRLRAVAEVEGVSPSTVVATLVSDVFGEKAARELADQANDGGPSKESAATGRGRSQDTNGPTARKPRPRRTPAKPRGEPNP